MADIISQTVTGQSIVPIAEKSLQDGKQWNENKNSVLCHGIKAIYSLKIGGFRVKNHRGNTLYPKILKTAL